MGSCGSCESCRERRIAPPDELHEPRLDRSTRQQHVAVAALAAQPDVGAEAIDQPIVPATGVLSSKPNDIAEIQLEDRLCGHSGRERIRASDGHGSGPAADSLQE